MKPATIRTLVPLCLSLGAGCTAVVAATAFDAAAVRIALQALAVASATLMAWRVGVISTENGQMVRTQLAAASPARLSAFGADRRRPTFDRETGLCTNWYYRLRVEEEIARAARYGQLFTMLTISAKTPEKLDGPRMAVKEWLRQVDFAGDLGHLISVLLPNTDRTGASVVRERLLAQGKGVEVRLAQYPDDGVTVSQLLGDDEWTVNDIPPAAMQAAG